MTRRRVLLTANSNAFGPAERLSAAVRQRLETAGAQVTFLNTNSPAEAEAALRETRNFDVVAVAGGDGAARRAAAALLGSGTPLALIPAGAANILAGELGVRPNPDRLAAMILRGPVAPLALGRANGEPFLVIAGAGLDGHAAAKVPPALKRRIGMGAYAYGVAHAWAGGRHPRLNVTVDGRNHRAEWAIALNGRLWPGSLYDAPAGMMRLALFPAGSRFNRAARLAALAAGRLDLAPDVTILPFSRCRIEADFATPTQVDGEVLGQTPLELEIDPQPALVVRGSFS